MGHCFCVRSGFLGCCERLGDCVVGLEALGGVLLGGWLRCR